MILFILFVLSNKIGRCESDILLLQDTLIEGHGITEAPGHSIISTPQTEAPDTRSTC